MSSAGLLNAVLLLLPMLIAGYMGLFAWRRRTIPGAASFTLVMAVIAGWCATAALVVISRDYYAARFWLTLMLALIPFLPPAILVTVAQTTQSPALIRRGRLLLWFIVPAITALLSLTSASQQIYIYDVQFVRSGLDYTGWINRFGFWSIIHLSYSYALVIYAVVLLVRQFTRMRHRTYRMRILLLTVGLVLPFAANIINTLFMEVRYFITPIIFNFSTPVLFWALFRYRLFELLPVAREAAFEHMDDAIVIVDRENRIVDVNPSAAALARQSARDIIEKNVFEVFNDFEHSFPSLLDHYANHQAIEFQTGDEKRYFDLTISPITRDLELVGKLIILRDVTEQRLAEARARHFELERERLNALSAFIESASHEFRTPLSIIKNSTFIINRTEDSAKRAEKVTQIDDQANRISLLVEALLNVVRVNANTELTLDPLNINTLITNVQQNVREEAAAKNLQIELDLAPQPLIVNAETTYLTQAVQAIVHNAVRYTPTSGRVTITTRQQDSQIIITVQDTGIGIDPEHLPHIFDVFYRVDKARSTAGFGTGLATASRVITLHGGQIDAQSQPGEGTTITIQLPAIE